MKRSKYPAITTVARVVKGAQEEDAGLPDGRWVPARPLPFYSLFGRLRATWLVFTGQADALLWDGQ
jgi:hypothetical protein